MDGGRDDFGGVQGPVQTGDGTQYAAGRDQYVAHGDQYVAGRDQVVFAGPNRELRAEVASLREALAELRLTATERADAERELDAVDQALRDDEPDRSVVGGHLSRLTEGLKEAGALASAGESVLRSLGMIARWLGPIGAGVLALLA
jgi:hypothetical protein